MGGPARYYAEARSPAEVITALQWADAGAIPVVVLGGGSNMLVADRGIDALVLRVRADGMVAAADGDTTIVQAGAGEPWDGLVAHAVANGWAGLECLSGIPGDVGATPIQNVGAYGQEVSETITLVHAIDRVTKAPAALTPGQCHFGYRDSIFKREALNRYVITGVVFALRNGGPPSVRYPELARHLRETAASSAPDLPCVRRAVLELRRRKSMLFEPFAENGKSAGSFFTNPTLDAAALDRTLVRIHQAGVLGPGETIPQYPAAGGRVKLPAAWLIEKAGFAKGTHAGPVGLSTRHALAIVNRGGASAADIVEFAGRVQDAVRDRFGVALSPEPVLVGFHPAEVKDLGGQ